MIAIYCILGGLTYNITNLCESISISGSLTGVCRQLDITMEYGIYTKNFPAFGIPIEMPIWVRDESEDGNLKEGLFSGKVRSANKTGEGKCTITAFDFAYYLKQSDITKNFQNISAEQGTKEILEELGVEINYLYPSNIAISKLIAQQNAYDSIMDLYTQVHKQTGELFYLSASYYNKIGVYKVNQHICKNVIRACSNVNTLDGNLISVEYKEDGENMVTRVKVYDENNQLVDTIDSDLYKQYPDYYGVIQKNYVIEEDKDYKTVVQQTLYDIDKDISVEVLGDYDYYTGSAVKVYIPWIDQLNSTNGEFATAYITSDTHTWDIASGSYTTKLELTLTEIMDEKEIEDANENADDMEDKDEYSSTKVTGASVVKYAKKFLGLPYVWGGTSLTDGADCSGFVQAVYAHFGVSIGRTTYDQVNNGKSISTENKSKWQKGDLIFPHSGHVVMYVGDGKVIHEPKTGDVCKISDVYFSNPIAVRRVI